MPEVEADFIVVGAGSAGSVLANRLSADGANRVLLLEAGPRNRDLSLRIPAAMATNLKGTKHNWRFEGEAEPGLGGRRIVHDRGRVLGGSSSINGMVFIRGHARDYDRWAEMGCVGWGYGDVLPYFRRMERYSGGEDAFRGRDGPMRITRPNRDALHPLSAAFLMAGREAGYPETDDICGARQEGFGLLDRSTHKGERWSAARGYLDPVRNRSNLHIETELRVVRVTFEGAKATGVVVRGPDGVERQLRARREVILSAGAVGSPHLLMLSGVGPGAHLAENGIDVLADRQGVGGNLNEHPDIVLKFDLKQPISLWPHTTGLGRIRAGLQWLIARTGVCASNHFEVVACVRSGAGAAWPDLQFTIVPIAMDTGGWDAVPRHAFQVHVGLMKAESRGRISLSSPEPMDAPRILVNYLDAESDVVRMRTGIRLVRALVSQPAFESLAGDEFFPGPSVRSDAALARCLRDHVETQWHLSGTARMGAADDPDAVTDPEGKVYGVTGLRVVDASLMPEVVNGNTNAPTIMMAEKLSDMILGREPLPSHFPDEADRVVWSNPERQTESV